MAKKSKDDLGPVTLMDVPITYKNFQGQRGQFNKEGERSFSVIIEDPEMAEVMLEDGWNLKPFVDEDGNITAYHMQVKINYDSWSPPRIYRVTQDGRNQLLLTAQTVGMLDGVRVDTVDIIINPYKWEVQGRTGIKAYVDTMYATIIENELDLKYAALLEGPEFFGDQD